MRTHGNRLLPLEISPARTTIASPTLADTVHASRSPTSIVPVCTAPLASGPPSSPTDTVTGSPVFARVIRYAPEPPSPLLPSPATTTYVPALAAVVVTSAAAAEKLLDRSAPLGLYRRSHGSSGLPTDVSPMRTTIASPTFALIVQTSRSPTS